MQLHIIEGDRYLIWCSDLIDENNSQILVTIFFIEAFQSLYFFKFWYNFIFAALCNNRICAENAECKNSDCVCKDGFHGNGFYKCECKYSSFAISVLYHGKSCTEYPLNTVLEAVYFELETFAIKFCHEKNNLFCTIEFM